MCSDIKRLTRSLCVSEYICIYLKTSLDNTQETGIIAYAREELGMAPVVRETF